MRGGVRGTEWEEGWVRWVMFFSFRRGYNGYKYLAVSYFFKQKVLKSILKNFS